MPKLEISAEANFNGINDSINRLINKLGEVDKAAAGTSSEVSKVSTTLSKLPKAASDASKGLAAVAAANTKLDSSLGKLKGADQASNALMNLGRVAQDAPFGFVGISNNINPLLESFQRLKAESGSTSGALKALASSLAGGAGLGLAISVATGLLTVLAQQGFFKTEKAADAAAEAAKKFKDEVTGIFADAGKEAAQATALVAVLKSETETRERKLQALKDLKEINPTIFNQLKLEGDAVVGLDAAYKNYLVNFKDVIAAKITQAKLEKAITKLLEAQGTTQTQSTKNVLAALKAINKSQNDLREANGVQSIQKSIDDLNTSKIAKANKEVEDLFALLGEQSKGIEIKIDKPKKESTKETIQDVIAQLRRDVNEANIFEGLFNVDKSKDRAQLFESAIQKLVSKFKLDPKGDLIKGLFDEEIIAKNGFIAPAALNAGVLKLGKDLRDAAKKLLSTAPIEIPISFGTGPTGNSALPGGAGSTTPLTGLGEAAESEGVAIAALLKAGVKKGFQDGGLVDITALRLPELLDAAAKSAELIKSANGIGTSLATGIASGIGDTLGKALAGTAQVGDIFSGIFQSLGASLSQLGDLFIQTGIKIAIFKKLALSNPAAAIVAGIALKALGAFVQAKTSRKGFADGGYVSGPGSSRSDSIPARLSNGEFVMQAKAVKSLGVGYLNSLNNGFTPGFANGGSVGVIEGGGGVTQVHGVFTVRGSDLVVVLDRAQATRGRQQ